MVKFKFSFVLQLLLRVEDSNTFTDIEDVHVVAASEIHDTSRVAVFFSFSLTLCLLPYLDG